MEIENMVDKLPQEGDVAKDADGRDLIFVNGAWAFNPGAPPPVVEMTDEEVAALKQPQIDADLKEADVKAATEALARSEATQALIDAGLSDTMADAVAVHVDELNSMVINLTAERDKLAVERDTLAATNKELVTANFKAGEYIETLRGERKDSMGLDRPAGITP